MTFFLYHDQSLSSFLFYENHIALSCEFVAIKAPLNYIKNLIALTGLTWVFRLRHTQAYGSTLLFALFSIRFSFVALVFARVFLSCH